MKPIHLVAALLTLYCGWQFFGDGRVAFYAMGGAFMVYAMILIMQRGREWFPACLLGVFLGMSQATCGTLFHSVADGRHFLCDRGTGFPISWVTMLFAMVVLIHYMRSP